MDKTTFLEELKKSLRVLKEEELQDIISEYEQHIDMKVEKGLTVEQAIADFGNVKELAAEILEAYHVSNPQPDHSEQDSAKVSALSKISEWFAGLLANLCKWMKAGWTACLNGCYWLGRQFVRPFLWCREKVRMQRKTSALKQAEKPEPEEAEIGHEKCAEHEHSAAMKKMVLFQKEEDGRKKNILRRAWKGLGNMTAVCWNYFVNTTLWCLRIGWNCCVVATAASIAVIGLAGLYCGCVLAVLLMQGYPLTGLTVGCFGIVLCFLAAAGFTWTLMWRKKEKTPEIKEGQHA